MSTTYPHYKLQPAVKGEFLFWWEALHSETAGGSQRADRAALRRADSLAVVECLPAYQHIFRRMAAKHEGDAWAPYQKDRIAALVGLAAHLKEKNEESIPEAMSRRADGADRNPVSDLRFARLLDSPDLEALYVGLRRSMPLIEHRASPAKLADDLFGWGDKVKKQWAYAYRWADKADT